MKKIYTVQYQIIGEEHNFKVWWEFLNKQGDVSNTTILKEQPFGEIKYPPRGAIDIQEVEIVFVGKVSKDSVEEAINYWSAIPYVGKVSSIDWYAGHALIVVDVSASKSHDINARNILELLLTLIEEGSPTRKEFPFGKAVPGIGKDKVISITGKFNDWKNQVAL